MDKLLRIGFFAGLAFLLFTAGIIAGQRHWWPAPLFISALEAYDAQAEKAAAIRDASTRVRLTTANLAHSAKIDILNRDAMSPGPTLVCGENANLFLMSPQGRVLREWKLSYSNVWPHPKHIASPMPDTSINCVSAYAYPNADVLVVFHAIGDTPYGYGLARLDKDSNVIWSYSANAHHDVYVGESGLIYTLTQKFVDLPGQSGKPVLLDYVNILSPEGQEQKNIPLMDAFKDTPYEALLTRKKKSDKGFDYTHVNSVMPLEEKWAGKFPMFTPGDMLLSLRNSDTLAVVNPESGKVVWAMQGPWRGQHHARFMENGHIMLFDNNGMAAEGTPQRSRLLEIDPASGAIEWKFQGKGPSTFYTDWNGSEEIQPNGNILIIAGRSGRLLEINRDKELLWSYTLPIPLYCARRYPANYFAPGLTASGNTH